jgi:L-ribulokinase
MADSFSLGIDYGTNSCRSLLVNLVTGEEWGSAVFAYPSGERGILTDAQDPHLARQNPGDYVQGMIAVVSGALQQARQRDAGFDVSAVVGLGIDTTGSTIMAVDKQGTPLGMLPEWAEDHAAQAWLWKDHTAYAEAAEITALAAAQFPHYLQQCGGAYSSEWFWSKVLKLRRSSPEVFAAAFSFVEHCDWLPALLSGQTDPLKLKRSVCAAGHKALFNPVWGGLPSKEFLSQLDPALVGLRDRLYSEAYTSDQPAGYLCAEWAQKLGLTEGIVISVGAFDAHLGAVGAGVSEGTMVKILGTSTCDLMVAKADAALPFIPGLCGQVLGSVLPGYYGIEAGQSAVGDLFLWLVDHVVPDSYGKTAGEKFAAMELAMNSAKPGAHGLLVLDWNNGNRNILTDTHLTGLLLGQTLHTQAHEIYRAYIEATAYGALTIVKRLEEYGVEVQQISTTGGLALKNATLMQIYADVLGRPIKVCASEQTCALGAALMAAVAAGAYDSVTAGQQRLCSMSAKVYEPIATHQATYAKLYALYQRLHDAFGGVDKSVDLSSVMKELIALRDAATA